MDKEQCNTQRQTVQRKLSLGREFIGLCERTQGPRCCTIWGGLWAQGRETVSWNEKESERGTEWGTALNCWACAEHTCPGNFRSFVLGPQFTILVTIYCEWSLPDDNISKEENLLVMECHEFPCWRLQSLMFYHPGLCFSFLPSYAAGTTPYLHLYCF